MCARSGQVAAALFGPARTMQWAAYFHYIERHHPAEAVGRIMGYGNLVIALVGDATPYALSWYIQDGAAPTSRYARYSLIHALLQIAIALLSAALIATLAEQHNQHQLAVKRRRLDARNGSRVSFADSIQR